MSLRRQLATSLLVQGAGAASVLIATLWLGVVRGPEQQGDFSRTKAEIEFVAALAMFGLPQALFYFVKSARLTRRAALRWTVGCAALALFVAAGYALLQHPADRVWQLALCAAVGVCVLHAQLRALLLVHERTEWFNLVTALPQGLVLAGVVLLVGIGSGGGWHWAALFAFAYAAASVLALARWIGSLGESGRSTSAVGWPELGRYGLAAWLTAALSTAAILLAQRWVEHTQGPLVLGLFTMAMTLAQVPLTPINYALPLLLRRWSDHPGAHAARDWAAALFGALLGAAVLVWLLAAWRSDLGLGPAYAGLAQALATLLVGAAAEAAARVLAVHANARGMPWIAVRAETARWCVLGIGWGLPLPPGILPICAVWTVAALAAAAVFALHANLATRRRKGFS